jgi:ribosomal protein S18 acetylase RimI-like enzyme
MHADLVIRRADAPDADALALAGSATFLEHFSDLIDGADIVAHCRTEHAPGVYRRWLEGDSARIWIVETPTRSIVGYLVLDRSALAVEQPRPGDLEVKRIYILGRHQGAGFGRRLMELAINEARALGADRLLLGVYSRNSRAIAFYEHLGFRRIGERRFRVGAHEYHDGLFARAVD